MSPEDFIIDSKKVLDRFGDWPHFHDMEVISLLMDRRGDNAPWIEFVVFVWTYTGRLTEDGFYDQTKHSLVRFRCERVTMNRFDDFNHQNVLDGIHFNIDESVGPKIRVTFHSIYGLGGELECETVKVVDVIPATADGEAL